MVSVVVHETPIGENLPFDGCEILEIEFYVFDLACFSDDFSHRFLFTAQDCFPDAGDENIVAGEIVELGVFVKG